MTELHVAASGPKAQEMVDVMLAEFDRWAAYAPSQAAGVNPGNPEEAAKSALYDVREDLADHLIIAVGTTLASWGVDDS